MEISDEQERVLTEAENDYYSSGFKVGQTFREGYRTALRYDPVVREAFKALDASLKRIICMDGGRHYNNRKCGFCDSAQAVKDALEKYKAMSEGE